LLCHSERSRGIFFSKKGFLLLPGLKITSLKQTFYSNGKLFLTGEYAVLDGGLAFALPTKFGQNLVVEPISGNEILWQSFDADGSLWFETVIPVDDISHPKTEADPVKNTLIQILHQAALLNPNALIHGSKASTHLTFPRTWGLGTSSTLINNIASWFKVDAFALLERSFGGSGYDIACAQNDTPIFYRKTNAKPWIRPVNFHPDFADCLYFVYLNKKQNSKSAIAAYKTRENKSSEIDKVSAIGVAVAESKTVGAFAALLEQHEDIMSRMLGHQKVKDALFADFGGTVKSLGAWGGDFVLAISAKDPTPYFNSKGYQTVIRYNDMIL
jgi:mevalonate kinase